MSDLYIKNEHGEFVPIKIERVMGNDWDGKIVLIKLGDEFVKASEKEEEMMYKAMLSVISMRLLLSLRTKLISKCLVVQANCKTSVYLSK